MGKEQPEAKNGLGENIKYSVAYDLSVYASNAGTVGKTPDTRHLSMGRTARRSSGSLHWVDGPKKKGVTGDGTIESLGLAILTSRSTTAIETKLVDDDKVGNASESIPTPLLTIGGTESSKETAENHDQVSNDGDENVCATKTSQEGKIKEQERSGDAPIKIAGIIDLAVDMLNCIWGMLVLLNDGGVFI